MTLSKFQTWILAIRPKTLTAAIAPVLMGTAMAFGDGIEHFPTALLCLFSALLIQIGTNLANDYFDFKKGVDTEERTGPTRVMQAELVSPGQMILAVILTFLLAILIGLLLVKRGGTPIAVILVLSVLSGILYTAGPFPLAYIGLGDLFVLIFFGPVAVGATYYLQSFEINMAVILAGFGAGLLSVAILCVNNLRDIPSDEKTGKRTLAVRFGENFAKQQYLFCILSAALLPVIIYYLIEDHKFILLTSLTALAAIPAIHTVMGDSRGEKLNQTLAYTGKLLLIYSIIFSIGWIV